MLQADGEQDGEDEDEPKVPEDGQGLIDGDNDGAVRVRFRKIESGAASAAVKRPQDWYRLQLAVTGGSTEIPVAPQLLPPPPRPGFGPCGSSQSWGAEPRPT